MNPTLHLLFTEYAPFTALLLCLLSYSLGRRHEWKRQRRRARQEEYLREQMHRRHWQHHGLSVQMAPALIAISMADLAFAFFTVLAIAVCALVGRVAWVLRPRRHDDDVWSEPVTRRTDDESIHIP